MVRRDGAEIRRQRLHEIAAFILKLLNQKNPLCLSKTLALLEYDMGITSEKLIEYLKVMDAADRFELDIENDRICKVREVKDEG